MTKWAVNRRKDENGNDEIVSFNTFFLTRPPNPLSKEERERKGKEKSSKTAQKRVWVGQDVFVV